VVLILIHLFRRYTIQVPIVILKAKDMRNSTNIFLINLSMADLLVLLVCTPTVLGEITDSDMLSVSWLLTLWLILIYSRGEHDAGDVGSRWKHV
jgi:7 transmembrane receptor (rhodopsin family)